MCAQLLREHGLRIINFLTRLPFPVPMAAGPYAPDNDIVLFLAKQQAYGMMVNGASPGGLLFPSSVHRSNTQKLALLSSLQFPTMGLREQNLDPAHRDTFNWIMEQSNPEASSYEMPSPFLQWLSTEEPLFWLSGKAGSGKSTLMNFLITHPTMDAVLQHAFPNKRILVAWHYLFERGKDARQKSREGLLRHLLHHLILQNPDMAQPIFNQQKATRTFSSQKSWSWNELKIALHGVLREKPPGLVIVLFIDGLDEYRPMEKLSSREARAEDEGSDDDDDDDDEDPSSHRARIIAHGHQDVADLILKISGFENVKLCVSSRPLLVFRDAFRLFSSIALHGLTERDISSFVASRLAGNEGLAQLAVLRPSFEEDVKKEILAKADGVFLWVRLVLDLLTRGLREGDTADELLEKLRGTPNELGGKKGLYMAMLLNLPADYRRRGYEYFQILQRSEEDLDPLVLSFAIEDPQVVFTIPMGQITEDEIDIRRKRTSDRLLSRCGGLLETHGSNSSQRINFIHQTAKDFVKKRSNWGKLLQAGVVNNFDGALALLRAYIILLKQSGPLQERNYSAWSPQWARISACLRYARDAESLSPGQTAELLLLLDRVASCLRRGLGVDSRSLRGKPSGNPDFDELLSNYPTTPLGVGTLGRTTTYTGQHWSVDNRSEMGEPRGKNFIAVAVQSNLEVFLKMSSKNKRVVQKLFHTDYPLLAYALVPYRLRDSVIGASIISVDTQSLPEITNLLLELGLDPNQSYEGPSYHHGCTVWEGFLVNGDFIISTWQEGPVQYDKEADNEEYRTWLANARLLVQHGADPNASCIIRNQKRLGMAPPREYNRRSALYCVILILWRAAKNRDWHGGLLELMIEKGARVQQGEWAELFDLAETMEVPEHFVRSVSDALSADAEIYPDAAVAVSEPQEAAPPWPGRSSGPASMGNRLTTPSEMSAMLSAPPPERPPSENRQGNNLNRSLGAPSTASPLVSTSTQSRSERNSNEDDSAVEERSGARDGGERTKRNGLKRMGKAVGRLLSRSRDS